MSVLSFFIIAKNRRHFPHSYFHIDGNKHSSLRASSLGALTAGREKEEELATTSLEFEYLHRKSRCEMPSGRDDC